MERALEEFDRLLSIVRKLRAPGGCPWDRAQKIENYKKFLLEEAYELVDEIDNANAGAIREELGDLFLILTVISEMLREKEKITLRDIFKTINEKLVSRHPHVFGSKALATKEEVLNYWIRHKAKKKKRKTIRDRLPMAAPALFLADIFFKEYAHIDKKAKDANDEKEIVKDIVRQAKSLERKKVSKQALSQLLFDAVRLGHNKNYDVEGDLRKVVLRKAMQIPYNVKKA